MVNHEIFISRDVQLCENEFPFACTSYTAILGHNDGEGVELDFLDDLEDVLGVT